MLDFCFLAWLWLAQWGLYHVLCDESHQPRTNPNMRYSDRSPGSLPPQRKQNNCLSIKRLEFCHPLRGLSAFLSIVSAVCALLFVSFISVAFFGLVRVSSFRCRVWCHWLLHHWISSCLESHKIKFGIIMNNRHWIPFLFSILLCP
jgi:hypothetical protein